MKENTTSAYICLKDDLGIEYRLCRLDYVSSDDGHYTYVFRPDYSVIDMLSPPLYQGIPGLDLDLRKEEYVRKDIVPCFISERTPGENRIDVSELLESVGMDHLNRLEWLIRTDLRYFGDSFYAIRYTEPETIDMSGLSLRFPDAAMKILKNICAGNTVILKDLRIDENNRPQTYFLLKELYLGNRKALKTMRDAGELPRLGRKEKEIPGKDLREMRRRMENGLMTSQQVADTLGISRATLFRKLRKLE